MNNQIVKPIEGKKNTVQIGDFKIESIYRESGSEVYQEIYFHDIARDYVWKIEYYGQFKIFGKGIYSINFEENPKDVYLMPKEDNKFELKIEDTIFEGEIGPSLNIVMK